MDEATKLIQPYVSDRQLMRARARPGWTSF